MNSGSSWLIALADPLSMRGDELHDSLPQRRRSLGNGIAQLIRGEAAGSVRAFEDEYRAAEKTHDGERALLALALGWLAEVRHFNMFPGGCGGGSVELELRWNGVERAGRHDTLVRQARTWPGAAAAADDYRWLQFLASRLSGLATIRDAVGHPQKHMVVSLFVQQFESARDDARNVSANAEAFLERSIAELQAVGGEHAAAEESLDRAVAAYHSANDEAGVAGCLALRGDWAVAPISSALVRNLMIADAAYPTSELVWMIEAVEGGTDGIDIAGARATLEEARTLYERADRTRGVASILLRQAYLAKIQRQLDRQVALAQQSAHLFETSGDVMDAQLANACALLAPLDARRFPEDRQAAAAIGAWGNNGGSFSYALGLGLLFSRAGRQALLRDGDYEKAEACFHLALALNHALGARCRQSQTLADLATLHQALGNRQRSQTHLDEAIDVLVPKDAAAGGIHPLVQQRAALLIQQTYREALDHRDSAGMARALERLNRLAPIAEGPAAFAVSGFIQETRQQAPVLIELYKGVDARNSGDDKGAEAFFERALAAAMSEGPINSLFLQAIVHATQRQYASAVHAFDQYQQGVTAGAGLSGALITAMRSLSTVRGQQEADIADRRAVEQSFSFMVRAKAYPRAAAHLQVLERIAGRDWWTADERPWRSLSDIAEMHEGLGDLREALDVYTQAIDQLEDRRSLLSRDELKTALAADLGVQYLYFQAVRAALRLAHAKVSDEQRRTARDEAFGLSERGRARALLDLLAANVRHAAEADRDSDAFRRWRQLVSSSELWRGMLARARAGGQSNDLVESLRLKIQQSEEELYQLQEKIQEHTGPSLSATGDLLTLDETARRLAPDTAMLQYMSLGDELLVWAVTRDGMAHEQVLDIRAATLARLVREYHSSCASGAPMHTLDAQSNRLAGYLLDPVTPVIEQHHRLIIIPYGELSILPFAALKWRGQWLGHQRTLTYLPSASMLSALSRSASRAPDAILAVGNPRTHDPPTAVWIGGNTAGARMGRGGGGINRQDLRNHTTDW